MLPDVPIRCSGAVQKSLQSVPPSARNSPTSPPKSSAFSVPKTSLLISHWSSLPLTPAPSTHSSIPAQKPSTFPSTSAILKRSVIFSSPRSLITTMLLFLYALPEFQQDSLKDSPINCARFGLHGSMRKIPLCYNYAHSQIIAFTTGFRYFDVLVCML